MTYFIKTFGCAMNYSDSERISALFESRGFSDAKKIEEADVVIINTCGVRQMAEDRVFGLVKNLRKNNPKIKIVITGCLSDRKDIPRRMKGVDFFCKIENIENIFREIGVEKISPEYERDYLSIIPKHQSSFQAFVPIMTGCNNFCSYCVVPYARGREVSRPAEEIISEVKALVKKGYKSITLLGQNVNSYCDKKQGTRDRDNFNRVTCHTSHVTFPKLLKKTDTIPGKFWITFISSHPKDMTDELIETISKCKKVCEYVHLPVQAGDDEILKKMNRKYTGSHYLRLIKKIKNSFAKNKPAKPYSITTDIIVGFPGETRKQFEKSAEIMKKVGFDMAYFGQYSPRPGTAAWKIKDDVTKKEKERREKFLNKILYETALFNNKKYLGKKIEILVEKEKKGFYFGKTRTQKNVKIATHKKLTIGNFVTAEIVNVSPWNLEAKI